MQRFVIHRELPRLWRCFVNWDEMSVSLFGYDQYRIDAHVCHSDVEVHEQYPDS